MQAIIEGKLNSAALPAGKKIAPIRKIEVRNTKISKETLPAAPKPKKVEAPAEPEAKKE